jgi:hypothetical protein
VMPLVLTGDAQADRPRHALIREIIEKAICLCEDCPTCNKAQIFQNVNLDLPALAREEYLNQQSAQNAGGYRIRQSCYHCLRSYRNQRMHNMLDRGDAVVVLRALLCTPYSPSTPYSPTDYDKRMIDCLGRTVGASGSIPELPPIILSSETPPLFRKYPAIEQEYRRQFEDGTPIDGNFPYPHDTPIDIEEVLGVYYSNPSRIVLYTMGIKWCAWKLGLGEDALRAVVLVHELGHWLSHRMPPGEWPLDHFQNTETAVTEGWAQLISYWTVDAIQATQPEFIDAFQKLNQCQSAPYHVFEEFKGNPRDQMMTSLDNLRKIGRAATLCDWRHLLASQDACPIPASGEVFEVQDELEGMPPGRPKRFRRFAPDAAIKVRGYYLFQNSNNQNCVVNGVTELANGAISVPGKGMSVRENLIAELE